MSNSIPLICLLPQLSVLTWSTLSMSLSSAVWFDLLALSFSASFQFGFSSETKDFFFKFGLTSLSFSSHYLYLLWVFKILLHYFFVWKVFQFIFISGYYHGICIYFGGDMLFCLFSASSGINISGINLLAQFFFYFCFSHLCLEVFTMFRRGLFYNILGMTFF